MEGGVTLFYYPSIYNTEEYVFLPTKDQGCNQNLLPLTLKTNSWANRQVLVLYMNA